MRRMSERWIGWVSVVVLFVASVSLIAKRAAGPASSEGIGTPDGHRHAAAPIGELEVREPGSEGEDDREGRHAGLAYRAILHGEGSPGALRRAVAEKRRALSSRTPGLAAVNDDWTWIGPDNFGGRVRSLLIHPTNPDRMWAASVSGGIWNSTDGGASWSPATGPDGSEFPALFPVSCMALDPNDPQILLAGTGESVFGGSAPDVGAAFDGGAGLFRSTDGGNTWSIVAGTDENEWEDVSVAEIAIDPIVDDRALVATDFGLYILEGAGPPAENFDIEEAVLDVKFNADGVHAVAGTGNGGVYWSNDGGETWKNSANANLNAQLVGADRIELEYAVATGADADGDGLPDIPVFASAFWNDRVALDENGDATAGSELWKSTNNGRT